MKFTVTGGSVFYVAVGFCQRITHAVGKLNDRETLSCIINCTFFNARSLNNKLQDLYSLLDGFLYNRKFDLLFVCESWLSSSIPDGLLLYSSPDYTLVRCDRLTGVGGGVCAFINCKFDYSVVNLPSKFVSLEVIGLDIISSAAKHRYMCI